MNTFFTVWFLVNGIWYANIFDGWDAFDRQTEAACQAAVQFAQDPTNRLRTDVQQQFTCEKDDAPKERKAA